MRIDVIVGNPPFNQPAANRGPAGTSGHTTLYKRFIELSLRLASTVALVVQRNGIRYADRLSPISCYCLDTRQHWAFAAGWFIRDGRTAQDCSQDPIIRKVYCLHEQWTYSTPSSGSFAANSDHWPQSRGNDVFGVVDTPTQHHPEIRRAWFDKTYRTGPHLLFKGLEARNSYVVVDEPSKAASTAALHFATVAEAEKARLVILNNPVIAYLKGRTKERTLGMIFRYVKRFDLSQIQTGHEIPAEWGLTVAEIQHLET